MIARVPHYHDLLTTIADILPECPNTDHAQRARQIVKDSQVVVPAVSGWLPVVDIDRNEWEYLNNERGIGSPLGWMLLTKTADVLSIYRNPKNDTEESIQAKLQAVRDWTWIVLSVG